MILKEDRGLVAGLRNMSWFDTMTEKEAASILLKQEGKISKLGQTFAQQTLNKNNSKLYIFRFGGFPLTIKI